MSFRRAPKTAAVSCLLSYSVLKLHPNKANFNAMLERVTEEATMVLLVIPVSTALVAGRLRHSLVSRDDDDVMQ